MTHLHFNHDGFYPALEDRPAGRQHRCLIDFGHTGDGDRVGPVLGVNDCVDWLLECVDCPDCLRLGLCDVERKLSRQ